MKKIFFVVIITIFLGFFSLQVFAQEQYRTNSNTIVTRVGNPESEENGMAIVAIELAKTIANSCNDAVKSTNGFDCLQGLYLPNVPNPDIAINQILLSARSYDCGTNISGTCLQCVGFVQGVVGGATGQILNNGGNAKDYATNVPTGYQYVPFSSGTPAQEGDIIIKTGGQWGHLAIITQIYDTSTIQVAEANFNYGGEIGLRNTTTSLWNGYLRRI